VGNSPKIPYIHTRTHARTHTHTHARWAKSATCPRLCCYSLLKKRSVTDFICRWPSRGENIWGAFHRSGTTRSSEKAPRLLRSSDHHHDDHDVERSPVAGAGEREREREVRCTLVPQHDAFMSSSGAFRTQTSCKKMQPCAHKKIIYIYI